VTLSLEDSEGIITNQDTVHEGIKTEVGPGDIFFSTAGSGLMHEELPAEVGKNVHGLQMFINLSAKNKEVKAKTDHLKASRAYSDELRRARQNFYLFLCLEIPIIEEASGLRVRVIIGKHADTVSPLQTLTPITLLDIKIPKGVSFTHAVPQGWNTFLLVLKGNLSVGSEKSSAPHLSAVSFEVEGDTVDFTSNEDSHVVLAAGEPIKEPIIFGGPFVANTREQLQKFQLDYMTGKMGQLKRSF
jgi:quercetin 2,3-dioxygenase